MTMEGRSDKRCITGTFSITFSNEFLPTLLIYDGKTVKSLPRFKFPQQFSLSANPTHFSNSSESIKLFEEVIISYLQKERKKLNFSPIQKALIIKTSIRCFQKLILAKKFPKGLFAKVYSEHLAIF